MFVINQPATLATALVPPAVLFTFINGGSTIIATIVAAVAVKERLTTRGVVGVLLGVIALMIVKPMWEFLVYKGDEIVDKITVDLQKELRKVKPMHAVNNGPAHSATDQVRSNLEAYREAGIPYARNHDAAFFANYGGEHTVDIYAVFPDFDADPYAESSYDFAMTDEYLKTTELAGTETFYRLGSKIEHGIKKYGTLPPKDFKKWAVICEHIIRHCNEGWANGFYMNLQYWEIWNEPDLDREDSDNKRTWGGTAKEFYELFVITATHLKKAFPDLKIGGPAMAGPMNIAWLTGFLETMTRGERVPLDFFSWHIYLSNPDRMIQAGEHIRKMLDQYGYTDTESILNEWNYVDENNGWTENFVHSIETIIGMKGAAFTAACMCKAQNSSIDMLMYYDARPCVFNGLFDFYTYRPLKGYYPFKMFSDLYKKGAQVACDNCIDGIDIVSAVDNAGGVSAMLSYYAYEENKPAQKFQLKFDGLQGGNLRLYLLDNDHDAELMKETDTDTVEIEMEPNTVIFISNAES